jgi:hypothetical protein
MRMTDHVLFYLARPLSSDLERCTAHVVEVIDADTLTIDVMRPGVLVERFVAVTRCDNDAPVAGCWAIEAGSV